MPPRELLKTTLASPSAAPTAIPATQPPAWLPDDMKPLFVQVMHELPAYPDRRIAADIWSRHVFPLNFRTLEASELKTRRLNGRACFDRREFVEFHFRKIVETPALRGGRRPAQYQTPQ